jgi:lipid-A-disaccharide synthase
MTNKKIYLIAGEASGDNIGSKLMRALKQKESLSFYGVGGAKMQAEGLRPLFPMEEISVMGFLEVIPKIPHIRRLIKQTVQDIIKHKPDVLVTIDSFGFNKRVVKGVRQALGKNIKIVHYVAPTVWAYKPKRVYEVARLYDLQLLILPFEKDFFQPAGVNSEYIGHPVVEDAIIKKTRREEFSLPVKARVLLIMAGSRAGEVQRLAPIFAETLAKLRQTNKEKIIALLPTLPHLESVLRKYFSEDCIISSQPGIKEKFFSLAEVALVKSGTSSVEMMMWGIPSVVAYKVNPLTYLYLKCAVKVKYVSIVNLIFNSEVIPELIQSNCRADKISAKLDELLNNPQIQSLQKQQYKSAIKTLGAGSQQSPSEKAASAILRLTQ